MRDLPQLARSRRAHVPCHHAHPPRRAPLDRRADRTASAMDVRRCVLRRRHVRLRMRRGRRGLRVIERQRVRARQLPGRPSCLGTKQRLVHGRRRVRGRPRGGGVRAARTLGPSPPTRLTLSRFVSIVARSGFDPTANRRCARRIDVEQNAIWTVLWHADIAWALAGVAVKADTDQLPQGVDVLGRERSRRAVTGRVTLKRSLFRSDVSGGTRS